MPLHRLTATTAVVGAVAALWATAACSAPTIDQAAPAPSVPPASLGPTAAASSATSPGNPPPESTPTPSRAAAAPSQATEQSRATPTEGTTPTESEPSPAQSQAPPSEPMPSQRAEALLSKGARGGQVRELQHRLRQLDWFSGDITGIFGSMTVAAVQGFQAKRGLSETGEVDHLTWDRLVMMTKKPSDDELHNRLQPGPAIMKQGTKGDKVRQLQARLKQIAWFSTDVTGVYGPATVAAVRAFQAKRAIPVTGEVDKGTWGRLTAMTRTPNDNELHNVKPKPSSAGLDSRCLTGRALCVSKRTNKLVWVINGRPQLRVDVRFGSQELPTRNGVFSVGWKSRNHVSSLYKTPMPFAMFFSGGQAVHYSPDFAARGYRGASHGCVNVRDRQVIEGLFNTVQVGDKVIVYG